MWDYNKSCDIGMTGVPAREKKEDKAEKSSQRSNDWKFSRFGKRRKPTDLRSPMNFKHKKYEENHTKQITIKLLKTNDIKKFLKAFLNLLI